MDLGLKKKIVLVTGSTKGIGFTIAKSFYDEGSQVIINSRHVSELKKKSKESLGEKYDIKEFHHVILGEGALPLDILEEKVDQYIENNL